VVCMEKIRGNMAHQTTVKSLFVRSQRYDKSMMYKLREVK